MKRFFCLRLVLILIGSSLSLPVRAEELPVPETTETLPAETVQTTCLHGRSGTAADCRRGHPGVHASA